MIKTFYILGDNRSEENSMCRVIRGGKITIKPCNDKEIKKYVQER